MKFVKIGYIAGSFGLKGQVKARPITENPEIFYDMKFLLLSENASGPSKSLKIKSIEPHGELFLVKCDGIDFKDQAETLRNLSIIIEEDKLPKIESDEVYWYMIEGAEVTDACGNLIGVLDDYLETGSCDVLRIKLTDGGYALISNNKNHVLSIDAKERKVVIEPEGLVREDI